MKQVSAVLEDTTIDEIEAALSVAKDWPTTISTIQHYEGRDVAPQVYRGVRFARRCTARVRMQIQVDDHAVDDVIEWMTAATNAGHIGPARVSIVSADAIFEIRPGQTTRKLGAVA